MDPNNEIKNPRVRLGQILIFTAAGLLIFTPSFSTVLPFNLRLGGLIGLILASFAGTLAFYKISHLRSHWRLVYIYFVASCALMLSGFAGDWALIISGEALATVKGFTLLKLAEDAAIISTIILLVLISRDDLEDLYLSKGRFGLGLVIGLASFLVFTVMGISSSVGRGIRPDSLREFLPAFLLIALADGFMEELLFRGLFLKTLGRVVGNNWAIVVTAVVFYVCAPGGPICGIPPHIPCGGFLIGPVVGLDHAEDGKCAGSSLVSCWSGHAHHCRCIRVVWDRELKGASLRVGVSNRTRSIHPNSFTEDEQWKTELIDG
jgi:hypothetical protein